MAKPPSTTASKSSPPASRCWSITPYIESARHRRAAIRSTAGSSRDPPLRRVLKMTDPSDTAHELPRHSDRIPQCCPTKSRHMSKDLGIDKDSRLWTTRGDSAGQHRPEDLRRVLFNKSLRNHIGPILRPQQNSVSRTARSTRTTLTASQAHLITRGSSPSQSRWQQNPSAP